ncbi:unnamed protein product [Penicillium egyptiacum]|uniref:Large ribosomal subunit protein uL11m n=3 Tax=Penicillium TaxID=5073 RepID=A0A9W4KNG5_9EURO|nr:unnamed protein product [Penicillium egyptiacum]
MTLGFFCSLPALANQRRRLKICKSSEFISAFGLWELSRHILIMARNVLAKDQFVKLIVGAGQASPSPPVGPALGSKGVKSMDFCKEFNARTAHINTGVPIPARVTVRPDRSFSFELRTPTTTYLLLNAANVEPRKNRLRGAMNPGHEFCGKISLKHVYEIAKLKHTETRLSGLSLEGLCKSVMSQAKSIGIQVVP